MSLRAFCSKTRVQCAASSRSCATATRSSHSAGTSDRVPPSSRAGRAAALDRPARPRRARARAAEHHRPGHRRSADRQRGRAPAHRRQRRVLRLRAHAARARAARPPAPHALRQRDRRCTSTRSSARIACTSCAASSPSSSGTRPTSTLFAARDRFGIKPLFYAQHDGTLYLASEVKALFAAGVPARWDHAESSSRRRACWCRSRTARCSTASSRCRPATTCWPRASGVRIVRYWDFDYPHADAAAPRSRRRICRGVSRTRWTKRCASACAPTCRSAAT